ncbi:ethanolamine ammonia-lyase reactivating factor EutA [Rugosimonospora africana]|uniref:ethanolamine ammonia-lyase reactivating factor EutA n=1 Tax=Rugosimonospora africana TaxID=556532 RepID=UPI0019454FB6|nr:ethanolamine ammonia-lyase reactivating factor EutA [Rugosimonospora africana]
MNQPEVNIESEERVELLSVGVDIGSATSHMVFSKITVEKVGTRYVTVGRDALYESPIILTPYDGPDLIDPVAMSAYVDAQFAAAGMSRDDVDTGALILTGVALDRANSRTIGEVFAREAGKMVAVSAGDNMECVLAAKGSGALERSETLDGDLLHIDIGGGTAKLVLCRRGSPVAHLAVDVGARLIVTDGEGVIVRLEEAGARVGRTLGRPFAIGTRITDEDKARVAGYLADELLGAARVTGDGTGALLRGEPLPPFTPSAISFSGGVSEYIYRRQEQTFDDLGPFLAEAIRDRIDRTGLELVENVNAGIRATVLGASQYTVQLSGSTIYVSDPDGLPVRNIQVVAPPFDMANLSAEGVAEVLRRSLTQFDLTDAKQPVAVSYLWDGLATYDRIDAFCHGIAMGMAARTQDSDSAVVLVSEDDIGRLIGSHLATERLDGRAVVSVDCVETGDFAFVDIGRPVTGSASVPVVIKSLIFPTGSN